MLSQRLKQLLANKTQRIYVFLSIVCILGLTWILYALMTIDSNESQHINFCFFKQLTSIPCPSCGSTRAVVCLLHGDITQSLLLNPFGIISMSLFSTIMLLLTYDVLFKEQKLIAIYKATEKTLNKRPIAIGLIILVLSNWIWNIYKGV